MKHILILLSIFIFTSAFAKGQHKYQLQKYTYDGIMKTQKLLDTNQSKQAEHILLNLYKSKKIKKNLDKAYVEFYLGYFYTLNNHDNKAIKHFKSALDYNSLPPKQISNTYLNLVQLTINNNNHIDALIYLDKLIKITKPQKAQYYIYKANIYFSQKKYKETISMIKRATIIEKKEKLSWLKMEFYCYYLQNRYKDAININKKLIIRAPNKKKYWLQLASLYGLTNSYSDSLATLDISRILKFDMSKNESFRLINLLRYAGLPFKAASIMQDKIESKLIQTNEKNLDILADLYYEAKDFSQAILFYKKAAEIHKNDKIYYKIAQILMNLHRYQDVIKYTKLSLEHSEVKLGQKELLLGKAYYELKNIDAAKYSFKIALKHKQSRKIAHIWLNYIK